jgi:hypothetical protein
MTKPDKIPLNTTLDPLTCAALSFMAAREDPGRGAANVPLRRIVREEVERSYPGAWDAMVDLAAELTTPIVAQGRALPAPSPRELAAQLSDLLRARAGR